MGLDHTGSKTPWRWPTKFTHLLDKQASKLTSLLMAPFKVDEIEGNNCSMGEGALVGGKRGVWRLFKLPWHPPIAGTLPSTGGSI